MSEELNIIDKAYADVAARKAENTGGRAIGAMLTREEMEGALPEPERLAETALPRKRLWNQQEFSDQTSPVPVPRNWTPVIEGQQAELRMRKMSTGLRLRFFKLGQQAAKLGEETLREDPGEALESVFFLLAASTPFATIPIEQGDRWVPLVLEADLERRVEQIRATYRAEYGFDPDFWDAWQERAVYVNGWGEDQKGN